jgi:hypothetical protein
MKKFCFIACSLCLLAMASCENHNGNVGNTKGVLYDTAISGKPTDTLNTDTDSYTNGPDNAPAMPADSSRK